MSPSSVSPADLPLALLATALNSTSALIQAHRSALRTIELQGRYDHAAAACDYLNHVLPDWCWEVQEWQDRRSVDLHTGQWTTRYCACARDGDVEVRVAAELDPYASPHGEGQRRALTWTVEVCDVKGGFYGTNTRRDNPHGLRTRLGYVLDLANAYPERKKPKPKRLTAARHAASMLSAMLNALPGEESEPRADKDSASAPAGEGVAGG